MVNRSRKTSLLASAAMSACALMLVLQPALAADKEEASAKKPKRSLSRMLERRWSLPGSFHEGRVKLVSLIGGTLYVAGTPRGIDAVDVKKGHLRWRFIGKLPLDAVPIERGNTLHVIEGGQFVKIHKTTGMELLRKRTSIGSMTPLYPGETTWMVGSTDDRVYVVMPATGLKAWRSTRVDNYIVGSAWDGKDFVYFVTASGTVYGASITVRQMSWNRSLPKAGCGQPVLAGKTIYIGCSDYFFYGLDSASGTIRWRVCLSAPVLGTPVVTRSRAYISTADKVLHAVDIASAKKRVLWKIEGAERVVTTTPEHVVFFRTQAKENILGIADAKTGKVVSEATVPPYEFFIGDPESNVFYAVTRYGAVSAFAVKSETKKTEK